MRRILIGCGAISILGVVVIIIAVVVAGLGGGGSETPVSEEQQQDSGQDQQQEQADTASIGEEVSVGDVTYTVTNAERVDRLEDPLGVQEPLTGDFVVVSFTFTNNADEPVTVSDLGLYLYDTQDRQFETDTDAALYLPEDTSLFMLDRVNPGLSQEIQTVYAVPPEAEGFELEVTSGFLASESARIDLGF